MISTATLSDNPFTIAYVGKMLGTTEEVVFEMARKLGIRPQQDASSGRLYFDSSDVEILRRMVDAQRLAQVDQAVTQSQNIPASAKPAVGVSPPPPVQSQTVITQPVTQEIPEVITRQPAQPIVSTASQNSTAPPRVLSEQAVAAPITSNVTPGSLTRGDISMIVETVSNAKESILRDLSHLLDDKLAGLDELVVELIRSKSENDALREDIKRLEESRNQYYGELMKFKPAAFGFWRKER